MAGRLAEDGLIRCWVDGRSWAHQDRGATPNEARVMAWRDWLALTAEQRADELALVAPELPSRPCFAVVEGLSN